MTFSLLFFVTYFNTFLQVGSTRAGRSNGSSWSNRKREDSASQSGPSVILSSYIRPFSRSKVLHEILEFVSVLYMAIFLSDALCSLLLFITLHAQKYPPVFIKEL
jgi:hypothetical protein